MKELTVEEILNSKEWFPSKEINSTQRLIVIEAMHTFADQQVQKADSEAKTILKELFEMYMVNVDSEGEPKAPLLDMVELWQRADRFLSLESLIIEKVGKVNE